MHSVYPQVYLLAEPNINWKSVHNYLTSVGGNYWFESNRELVKNPAQALIEFAGRLCYKSWIPGLNPNVTKIREDQKEYLGNVIASGHGSVLEHAQFSFIFQNVSRVATHEIVRHRAGVAISQESMRYVRITDIGMWMPDLSGKIPEEAHTELLGGLVSIVEQVEDLIGKVGTYMDTNNLSFKVKKEVTSAIRRLAPMGISTDMVWSANVRTLRHVLEARTDPAAEAEMRIIFDQVGYIMRNKAPFLFQDFTRTDNGAWIPEHSKI